MTSMFTNYVNSSKPRDKELYDTVLGYMVWPSGIEKEAALKKYKSDFAKIFEQMYKDQIVPSIKQLRALVRYLSFADELDYAKQIEGLLDEHKVRLDVVIAYALQLLINLVY